MPYKPIPYWAQIPHPMSFKEATSVAVDSEDRVYIFNRGNWPLMIFDADGNFLETWGEGEFDRPHGIFIDAEDNLFMADDEGHFVDIRRTPSGELIFTFRRARQTRSMASRATPSIAQPTSSSTNLLARSSSPMATETPASTSSTTKVTT